MKLVYHPVKILSTKCEPLNPSLFGTKELSSKVEKMAEIMKRHDGVGIAAPQVGWNARVFVVFGTAFINPSLIFPSKKTWWDIEGCLSLPERKVSVERYEAVTIKYSDLDGNRKQSYITGFYARAIQHEYDHIEGITMLERGQEVFTK